MAKKRFEVAVDEETAREVGELVDECATRSQPIRYRRAILTAIFQTESGHVKQVREHYSGKKGTP